MSTENLQGFFESSTGQIIVSVVIVLLFILILITGKEKKFSTKVLVTCGVLVALSVALGAITLFRMPQGGSVTPFSMVPIVLAGYLFGLRRGVMVGMSVGLLNLIFNPYVIHPLQLLLDYPIAFGALALGAIFRHREKVGLTLTYIIGVLGRYIVAVVSGVVFFSAYAPEGFSGLTWSLFYNITYLGVEAAVSIIILSLPPVRTAFEKLQQNVNS